jgi:hypothetical protein
MGSLGTDEDSDKVLLFTFNKCVNSLEKPSKRNSYRISIDLGRTLTAILMDGKGNPGLNVT